MPGIEMPVNSVSTVSNTVETRIRSPTTCRNDVKNDLEVTSGSTFIRLKANENTPMCFISTSYEKVSPSESQVGSDDIDGSAVWTTAVASLPSGRGDRNANARPSGAWPW